MEYFVIGCLESGGGNPRGLMDINDRHRRQQIHFSSLGTGCSEDVIRVDSWLGSSDHSEIASLMRPSATRRRPEWTSEGS